VKGFDMSWRTATAVFILLALVFAAGCRQPPTFPTPVEALTAFPGYLDGEIPASFQLLAQRTIPEGEVLLYAFGGSRPDVAGRTCVATTFVSKERNGWRAQSSSSLGCRNDFPQPEEVVLGYTIGGNITDLATVFGMAQGGAQVRVHWPDWRSPDGLVGVGAVEDGYVLLPHGESVRPELIEILDEEGRVIHTERFDE
jgi:hypothetical protein